MKPKYPKVTVQLSGEDGNAFFITTRVRVALRIAKIPQVEIDEFTKQAESGDYDHPLQTCFKWVTVR